MSACSKTYIPNTDVEDSSQNRKVISFCEDYRHAVEERLQLLRGRRELVRVAMAGTGERAPGLRGVGDDARADVPARQVAGGAKKRFDCRS